MTNETPVVNVHSGLGIITDENREMFLLSQYDGGYPVERYQLAHNLIGGNYSPGDKSSEGIFNREVLEELGSEVGSQVITGSKPFADYFIKLNDTKNAIHSVYGATVDKRLLEELYGKVQAGESIINEGLGSVLTIDELRSPDNKFAWGTPNYLSDYLGENIGEIVLDHRRVGMPRESLSDYTGDSSFDWKVVDDIDSILKDL